MSFLSRMAQTMAALGHAVAAANLRVIGHGREVRPCRLTAAGFGKGPSEHQPVTQFLHVGLVAHQAEIPLAVGDIAIHHSADCQLAVIAQNDSSCRGRDCRRAG